MTEHKSVKKKHSYLKMIGWMTFGGVIGGILGFGSFFFEDGVSSVIAAAKEWLSINAFILMGILLAAAVIISIVCHRKGEALIRQYQMNEDDDSQETIDKRYDFWANIGMTGTSILLYLAFLLLAFGLYIQGKDEAIRLLGLTVLFLAVAVICAFYQISAVKQICRKDPLKHADAADWNFQKNWIESCDEAEKQIIYVASYKAFSATRIILLVATVVAMMGELFWGNGLTTVVFLTVCNIISTLIYTYHAMKAKPGM